MLIQQVLVLVPPQSTLSMKAEALSVQKPFMKVWPTLLGLASLSFTGRTIASIAMMEHPDPEGTTFSILKHGLFGGAVAALRTLDGVTDMQVGYLLVGKVWRAWPLVLLW